MEALLSHHPSASGLKLNMLIVVGLGNPGSNYAKNRHNIGFMAVDAIQRLHSFSPFRSKFQGHLADGVVGVEKVLLLKPTTFMNSSGIAVQLSLIHI